MTKSNRLSLLACIFLTICTITLSISCGPGQLASGNSSETTNTAVLTSDNQPAGNATVRLVCADWKDIVSHNANPVICSTKTDKKGIAHFDSLPQEKCNLQIDHDSSAILIRNFSENGELINEADTIVRLKKTASLDCQISTEKNDAVLARLEGTAYSSEIADDGSFSIPKVAPGEYLLVLLSQSGKIDIADDITLKPSEKGSFSNISADFTNAVIDNFNDGDTFTILSSVTGSHWYRYYDSSAKSFSQITKDVLQSDNIQGNALHASITLNLDTSGSWAGVGFCPDINKNAWDLSGITAISFRAKGNGSFRVSLESALIDSISTSKWPHYGALFNLTDTWQTITIPVSSLNLIVNSIDFSEQFHTSWVEAAEKIVRIEFEASPSYTPETDELQLWLDDVTLEGISNSDLLDQFKHQ